MGSKPESRSSFGMLGIARGVISSTASEIALMCAGVVPQQPPTILTKPDCAKSLISFAVYSGTHHNLFLQVDLVSQH